MYFGSQRHGEWKRHQMLECLTLKSDFCQSLSAGGYVLSVSVRPFIPSSLNRDKLQDLHGWSEIGKKMDLIVGLFFSSFSFSVPFRALYRYIMYPLLCLSRNKLWCTVEFTLLVLDKLQSTSM